MTQPQSEPGFWCSSITFHGAQKLSRAQTKNATDYIASLHRERAQLERISSRFPIPTYVSPNTRYFVLGRVPTEDIVGMAAMVFTPAPHRGPLTASLGSFFITRKLLEGESSKENREREEKAAARMLLQKALVVVGDSTAASLTWFMSPWALSRGLLPSLAEEYRFKRQPDLEARPGDADCLYHLPLSETALL